jgi:hypothetical protein
MGQRGWNDNCSIHRQQGAVTGSFWTADLHFFGGNVAEQLSHHRQNVLTLSNIPIGTYPSDAETVIFNMLYGEKK